MTQAGNDKYDTVIIGAGISGLVCGCFLAKAGMKVLIAEQHCKPGGYCTSFERKNFIFDAAPHCFGSYRKDGAIRKIFTELELEKKITIIRADPSDVVITPDYRISYFSDIDKTIKQIQTFFPEETGNIQNFINFLIKPDLASLIKIRGWSFKQLLDRYFRNDNLKTILAAPLLGIGGLPPSLMSALTGTQLVSEFLLDGGYYPVGGMQTLPNALAERFQELGGVLLLSCSVKKIKIINNSVEGVFLENGGFVPSKFVVSNCDSRETFFKLVGKKNLLDAFYHKVKSMKPSTSYFVLYLGIDSHFKSFLKPGTNLCYFSHYNLENAYASAMKGDVNGYGGFMSHISHDRSTLTAIIPAPYRNKFYWNNNKDKFLESFVERMQAYLFPNLSKHIIYKDAATPYTLHRYTRNYKGAAFGWASIPAQFADPDFIKPSFIHNLYMTGHWTTHGSIGIAGVSFTGYNTANVLLKRNKYKKTCYNLTVV